MSGETKECPGCRLTKPISEFHKNKRNKDGLATRCKPCRAIEQLNYLDTPHGSLKKRAWRENNKEYQNEYMKKYRSTQKGKLEHSVRNSLRRGVLRGISLNSALSALGYSMEDLRVHLENQFERGMSWENYGEWHIDHRIPLAALEYDGVDDPAFLVAWDIENLQPMWAVDNMKKGDKVDMLDVAIVQSLHA